MDSISKKICIVGQFGVGKTSLLRRYVSSIFSEEYLSTIGVNIEQKKIQIGDKELKLIIWDIAGESSVTVINPSYLKGAHAVFYVVDLSRKETIINLSQNIDNMSNLVSGRPVTTLLNKSDLLSETGLKEILEKVSVKDYYITSAKTGENVNEAFEDIAKKLINEA